MQEDIRWIQRLSNWERALQQLRLFMAQDELNHFEEQGLIQCFEYNHELAWKTQKDFLEAQGVTELFGSKNVARKAFETGLIDNGAVWIAMIESRNLASHTYNQETTDKIVSLIIGSYYGAFETLFKRLTELAELQTHDS